MAQQKKGQIQLAGWNLAQASVQKNMLQFSVVRRLNNRRGILPNL